MVVSREVAIPLLSGDSQLHDSYFLSEIVGEKSEVHLLGNVPLEKVQGVGLQSYLKVLGDADELATGFDRAVLRVPVVGGH